MVGSNGVRTTYQTSAKEFIPVKRSRFKRDKREENRTSDYNLQIAGKKL